MKTALLTIPLMLASHGALAGLLGVFELEDGHTNWQYVANTSGTLLILALSFTLFKLLLSHREARRYNRELEEIRSELEQRVRERTATLDESNRLLQQSNQGLEDEIAEHRATTDQLRRSEAYIASMLHSMPTMLIGLDQEGQITQWNRRAQEISGLSAESVIGRNLWQAYPAITLSPDQIQAAMRTGEAVSVKQSQRDQFYFDVSIYPLEEPGDTGVVVMIDDVTQRVNAENKLIQRDKMSSMGELAASMAHDINAPLTGMLENARALRQQVNPADQAAAAAADQSLEEAEARWRQGSAVINNLLEFSTAGIDDKQPEDVARLLDHSLELAGTMLSLPSGQSFADIRVERDYGDTLPNVPCHAAELQQVFLSLLRHCCRALGDSGGVEPLITVTAEHYFEALWIKISHNGRGISPEEQQYIFEPFFRETGELSGNEQDAGGRLSFPYFIITEQHRGQLAVTSDADQGSTFHIQLLLH